MSEITKCVISQIELQSRPSGCNNKDWVHGILWNKGFYFILNEEGYPILHKPVGVVSCTKDKITGDLYYTQERPSRYEYNEEELCLDVRMIRLQA